MICHRNFVQALARLRRMYGNTDGDGARPFLALSNLVFNYLTFTEFLNGYALKLRVMKEQIVPISFDESKTSIRNQSLNFTLWHFCSPM